MEEAPVSFRAQDELAEGFPFKIYTVQGRLKQPLHTHD